MAAGRMLLREVSNNKALANLSSDGARLLYTWMLSHLDSNGNFYADPVMVNNLVFTRLGKSTKDVEKYLNDLLDAQLIVIYEAGGELYLNYPNFFEMQPNIRPDREGKCTIPTMENLDPDKIRMTSGESPTQIKLNKEKRIYSQIIDYLNGESGRDYTAKSKGTQRHIDARINEGRTMEDFKLVIDCKVAQWKNDPKMSEYLRPETLFGSKFEGYLEQAKNAGPMDGISEKERGLLDVI